MLSLLELSHFNLSLLMLWNIPRWMVPALLRPFVGQQISARRVKFFFLENRRLPSATNWKAITFFNFQRRCLRKKCLFSPFVFRWGVHGHAGIAGSPANTTFQSSVLLCFLFGLTLHVFFTWLIITKYIPPLGYSVNASPLPPLKELLVW